METIISKIAKLAVLSLVAMMSVAGFAPDASAANPKTFATGSLIIPMDATSQNLGMFKAYGLVYKLLQSNIPVYWLILGGKSFDGIDFSVNANNFYTGAVVGTPYSYTGGPFVIDQSNVATATPIITAWRNANGGNPALAVHVTTAPLNFADVKMVLNTAPRIALEQTNASIAIAYFNAAGIPDGNGSAWTALSPNVLSEARIAGCPSGTCSSSAVGDGALFTLGACSARKYDVFVTPHNSGYAYSTSNTLDLGTQTYAELDYFVGHGGGWIALCHSILSNENAIVALYNSTTPAVRALFQSPSNGGFLTQSGFTTISNASGIWTVDPGAADLPIAQAVQTTVANGLPGGSVQNWPSPFGPGAHTGAPTYWGQAERVASFNSGTGGTGVQYDTAVNGAYHNGEGQGKMTFLGGHSYSTAVPYATNFEGPYLRFFYNSLFFNSAAVANMTLVPGTTTVPQGNTSAMTLTLKNTGGSVAVGVGASSPVVVTLLSGVTYISMASGPAPISVVVSGGTTTITFAAGTIVDVAGGASAFVINTSVYFATAGTQQVATLSGNYGDQLAEAFTSNSCASVLVAAAPGTAITKTPSSTTASVGDIVTWTLNYSNPGASSLTNAYVEDLLPTTAFAFVSATPAPTSAVPAGSNTRLRWTVGTLAAAGSGSIALRAAVQTATGAPFTNTATLNGNDAAGNVYSATAAATVDVLPPAATLVKSVTPAGAQNPNTTLTYTLSPSSPGPALLANVKFFDAPPLNTNTPGGFTQGATFGAFPRAAGVQGTDTTPDTTMDITEGASPFTQALGSTLTVTMALVNLNTSSGSITSVTASLDPSDGVSSCVPLSAQPVATIANNNNPVNITFTCTIASTSQITWNGSASGTFAGNPYDFPAATSPSILGVPTTTGTNVVQWLPTINDNTPGVPSTSFAPGTSGVFALNGTTNIWEKYDVSGNSWITSPAGLTNNLPATAGDGAALVYDGGGFTSGFAYALRGGGANTFWRYPLGSGTGGTWSAMANAPFNVGAGGALARLGNFVYALRGVNTNSFARYDLTANTWLARANAPQKVAAGGSLATDGTYLYALQGNAKNTFLRYNPTANSWTTMANLGKNKNVGAGGALTAIGSTIYALRGAGTSDFFKYAPNTNTWTPLAATPLAVTAGGALTTDGTTVFAFRGGATNTFWSYNTSTNSWSANATTLASITTGGALTWVPGSSGGALTASLAAPVLVTGSGGSPATVQVVMTLTSTTAVTGITPTNLTALNSANATPANGTPAANCTLVTSTPQNIAANGTLTFTWNCTGVTATGTTLANTLGTVTFSAGATGTSPPTTWAAATSNSMLVTQPLSYTVKIDNPTTATQVTNQGLLVDTGAFSDGVPSNVVTTPVIQPAAVTATKSVAPTGQVAAGASLVYTIAVQNTTANGNANVVVTDLVPAGTTLVGTPTWSKAVPPGNAPASGTCSTGATVSCNLGNLGAFGAGTVTMTVTANTPAAAGITTINNTAGFTLNGSGSTTNTVSNTILATPAVTIAKAESVVPAANGSGFITPGSTITYTLTVNNPLGAVPATSVVATDLVPAGTTYAGPCTVVGGSVNTCSSSGSPAGSTVTFNIGNLAANATATLTFKVLVDNPAQDGDTITNSASVTAATNIVGQTYTAFSNLVSYPIVAAPVIAVSKVANPITGTDVVVGQTIIYTLTIANTGTANTQSAFVRDAIPLGTTYIANTTCLNGTLTPPGGSWTCVGANGVMVPELTPGVPPAGGAMTVYSPGQGDADGGTLVVGSNATVSFAVTVNGTPDATNPSGVILNTAMAGTATTTPVTSSTTTHTKRTNLAINKTVPSGAYNVGDYITFTILASNSGPSSSNGAVIGDVTSTLTYFAADTVTCGNPTGGAVCPSPLTLGILEAGVAIPTFPANSSLTFTVSGYPAVSTTTQPISNTATLVAPTGIADGTSGSNPTHTSTANTSVNAFPTVAIVSRVNGYVESGTPWFEWETVSEVRTAGFNVVRKDATRNSYLRVNARLLPALIGARHGGVYRFVDPAAVAGGTYTYGLEEVEITGKVNLYGPYTVTYGAKSASAVASRAHALAADPAAGADKVPKADKEVSPGYERKAHAAIGRSGVAVALAVTQPQAPAKTNNNTAMRILVEQDGLYSVTADQIASALGQSATQVKTWIGKTQLRLQQKGQAVAWKADPAGDKLYFYGQALQGTDAVHTRYNVYWLDQTNGLAMNVVAGTAPPPAPATQSFLSTIHAKQYVWAYTQFSSDPDSDFWYWDTSYAFSPGLGPKIPFTVTAPGAAAAGTATIRAYLQGASDLIKGNDHHAHLYVNGVEVNVGGGTWDGIAPKVLTGTFDASVLKIDGSANLVEVAAELDSTDPGVYSVFEVDRFDLDYPRFYRAADGQLSLRGAGNAAVTVSGFASSGVAVLNVTDPLKPQWIAASAVAPASGGYAVTFAPASGTADYLAALAKAPVSIEGDAPSTLKSTNNAATYLVLAPSVLRDGANALAAYRNGMVVELRDIYDEFNYGIANPHAIQGFLAYAASNWKTKPKFVALLGKGSFDPKDYLGAHTNLFPMLMAPTPDGLYPGDNRFADFNNDGVPDVAIGRIPALTNDDVTQYLAKVQAYESAARRPANQALVLADNPDEAGNFTANSQEVASALTGKGYVSTQIYLETTTAATARSQLLSALNASPGIGLFHYVGHGGTNQLADENLLANDTEPGLSTLNSLSNTARQPIFMAFTCAVGDGSYPGYDSLVESLLWRQSGGAVAAFAPSALSDNSQAHKLDLSVAGAMGSAKSRPTLGEATAAAIAEFARNGGARFMREVYTVHGDPGLRIQQ